MTQGLVLSHPHQRWQWGSIGLVIVAWEVAAIMAAGSFVIAGPIAVLQYLASNLLPLGRALLVTGEAAVAGFIIGNLVAVVLAALAMGLPRLERLVSALALLFFCLPLVATGPILRVIYGAGAGPQIALAALAVYYTTYLCLLVGLRATPAGWLDLVRSYGRGRWMELIHVRARAAFPYLVAGLQIAAPAAFLGSMVGEFTGAERGLGVLSIRAMRGLDVTATWAIAALAGGNSALAYWFFGWVGRRLGAAPPPILLAPLGKAATGVYRDKLLRDAGSAVLITTVVLGLWIGLMDLFRLNPFFAKRPLDIWNFLVTSPGAQTNRATLLDAFGQTLALTLPGYLLGLALGAALAILIVLVPVLASTVLPLAVVLRSVPIVTTAPLLVMTLGRGAAGTITIVAVMIFFPTLAACLEGLRRAPAQVMSLFDSYAAGRRLRLVHAQLPAMLPAFFATARMAVPAALLAATTAEWLATGSGIGALMALTASTSNYAMLWSAVVLLALTASFAYAIVQAFERRILSTYASEQLAV